MTEPFRFNHSTEWGKDLEIMRRSGPNRWTGEQLDELQRELNSRGLAIVADAIGSLRFDKVEIEAALDHERRK
jgi:hypothetical protein